VKMVPPWRLNQLLERVETGPICTERDFDLRILYPKLRSLIKEYDLKFDPAEIVPSDNSLADDLWNAAWAAYNWGIGRVRRHLRTHHQLVVRLLPQETQGYLARINRHLDRMMA